MFLTGALARSGLMFRVTNKESLRCPEIYCPWACSPQRSLWSSARPMPRPEVVEATGNRTAARTGTTTIAIVAINRRGTTDTSRRPTPRRIHAAIRDRPATARSPRVPMLPVLRTSHLHLHLRLHRRSTSKQPQRRPQAPAQCKHKFRE